jgi:hypothetical protein
MQSTSATAAHVRAHIVLMVLAAICTDKIIVGASFGIMARVEFSTSIANASFVVFTFKDDMSNLVTVCTNTFIH